MNEEIHWDLLRGPIVILVIGLLIAGALVVFSDLRFNEVNDEYESERRKLEQFARNYQSIIQEEKLYKAYVDRFQEFVDAGYIGEEHRLVWIELIQEINRSLKLPVLRYDITPRKMLDLNAIGVQTNEDIRLYESTMSLNLGLLHTGDLYTFFSRLGDRAKGLFEIRGCDLQQLYPTQTSNPNRANVNASCVLSWYTVELGALEEVAAQ